LAPNPNQRKVVDKLKTTGAYPNIESIEEYNSQLIDYQLIMDTKH
jgi:hypothetical protein